MDDLISRQAAIDAIGKTADELYENIKKGATFPQRQWFDGMAQAQSVLENLPSAQPEQRWIPVSERLPEEDDYKSCIECLDGAVWYFTENGTMGLGYYYKSTKEWSTTGDLKTDGKVVAWKPLPEPYKESEGKE